MVFKKVSTNLHFSAHAVQKVSIRRRKALTVGNVNDWYVMNCGWFFQQEFGPLRAVIWLDSLRFALLLGGFACELILQDRYFSV